MNKLSKLALEDYLLEANDLNLKLLVQTINPLYILKGSSKKELAALISKYDKDKSKLRLSAIENYLGTTPVQRKTLKQVESIPVVDNFSSEKNAKAEELDQLRREYLRNIKTQSPEKIAEKQFELTQKIKALEYELGMDTGGLTDAEMYQMGDSNGVESKSILFASIFGDFNEQGTAAWSLVNPGGMTQFSIDSTPWGGMWFNPDKLDVFDQVVREITGKKKQPYLVTEDKSSSPSRWIFSKTAIRINQNIRDDKGRIYGADILKQMVNADYVPK